VKCTPCSAPQPLTMSGIMPVSNMRSSIFIFEFVPAKLSRCFCQLPVIVPVAVIKDDNDMMHLLLRIPVLSKNTIPVFKKSFLEHPPSAKILFASSACFLNDYLSYF
jgi:hypothetical protein